MYCADLVSIMNRSDIRRQSWERVASFGLIANEGLPLIEDFTALRQQEEVIERILCLHVMALASFGFDRRRGGEWLRSEKLYDLLDETENTYLEVRVGDYIAFINQMEGMWALAWALNKVQIMQPLQACSDTFYEILPDLTTNESSKRFRIDCNLRDQQEIFAQADLYYCLHWSIRELVLAGGPKKKKLKYNPVVIIERRRALHWLLGDKGWYEIAKASYDFWDPAKNFW